ncbi:hypothetical protein Acav_4019 [Paracidovorax avenae ATCC 19860]|uniref:Lipoprotein n=1 Tax=Paracidovorax avenae (strain ATCC 19860 / DSM 7227 / CCUG 15838 / JCM 20985 / LMG 2117 / NCPPB 1011) TaxID=643561 RepID=F0Q479_PARA1|nr:hypothetical protein [Paracidovorax avenae]ADX47909.1 hypothetical protein Acav_4019 [Paracidovorax avenae ATCC 19860]AVS65953.1 hypothetical protein C8245_09950 [Paracidovorax avenae]
MNFKTLILKSGSACVVAGAMALAGCAALAPATPEQAVKERAEAYWKARMAGQYEKTYALTPPSYRAAVTKEQFARQFGNAASVTAAEVTNVECQPEKCVAKIKLTAKPMIIGVKLNSIDTYLDETWVQEDGQWWRFQDL